MYKRGNAGTVIFFIVIVFLVGYAFIMVTLRGQSLPDATQYDDGSTGINIAPPVAFKPYEGPLASTTFSNIDEVNKKPENKLITLTLSGSYNAQSSDFRNEYLVINASNQNQSSVKITGMKIKSAKSGQEAIIPKGFKTFKSANTPTSQREDIYLAPGERAILATSKSPVGSSFKLNICSGYLEQYLDFNPSIFSSCPLAKDDLARYGTTLNDACLDYIDTIGSCQKPTNIPIRLNNQCQEYINSKVNYTACVDLHQKDKNFYKDEWRVYFDRDLELWKNSREEIILVSETGETLDTLKY